MRECSIILLGNIINCGSVLESTENTRKTGKTKVKIICEIFYVYSDCPYVRKVLRILKSLGRYGTDGNQGHLFSCLVGISQSRRLSVK